MVSLDGIFSGYDDGTDMYSGYRIVDDYPRDMARISSNFIAFWQLTVIVEE